MHAQLTPTSTAPASSTALGRQWRNVLRVAALAAAGMLCAVAATPAQADELASESRTVDARAVKIRLDGVISLKLRQGAVPSLTLYGEPRYLQKIITEQRGDTLHIGTNLNGVHMGKMNLRAELTLPKLDELVSDGVGAAEISSFSGDKLTLALEGAGAVKADAQYKYVTVKLGGVGSMSVKLGNSDNVDLHLRGAGHIDISGQSKTLSARLGGVGSLDARQLKAGQVDVDMSGLGSASLYASNAASLKLSGLGSATVYGNPATRSASARGLGSVSWQ